MNIEYKKVFYYFEKISEIPRGSGNNKGISDYLVCFAKEHGLRYVQDEFLNVIIYKDASKGYENIPGVIIQAHMDMVCEKTHDSQHDFTKEGLDLYIEDGFVKAKDTTLGGDDGIGVAYALAFLEDSNAKHPLLEAVFTIDEETGMNGAIGLDGSLLKGHYLLNIDSEDEGILLSSCAGGVTADCRFIVDKCEKEGLTVNIKVFGLKGGHSGTEINKNGQNAIILLNRIIEHLDGQFNVSVISITGGDKDNVIPNSAFATIVIDEREKNSFMDELDRYYEILKSEIIISEPQFNLEYKLSDSIEKCKVMTCESKDKLLSCIMAVPNGVQVMSSQVDGFVESSLNLGSIRCENEVVHIVHSLRSSAKQYKEYMFRKIERIYKLFGGDVFKKSEYPAWEYKNESILRKVCAETFFEMFNKKPKIEGIHAGLECGILSEKVHDLDMVSFGPDIFDIHTVDERLDIESTKRMYDYMVAIVENLCNC